jgi:hypothetical protein
LGVKSKLLGSKALNGGKASSGKLNSKNLVRMGWGQGKGNRGKILRIAIGAGKGTKRAASKIHIHITLLRFRPRL